MTLVLIDWVLVTWTLTGKQAVLTFDEYVMLSDEAVAYTTVQPLSEPEAEAARARILARAA